MRDAAYAVVSQQFAKRGAYYLGDCDAARSIDDSTRQWQQIQPGGASGCVLKMQYNQMMQRRPIAATTLFLRSQVLLAPPVSCRFAGLPPWLKG